MNSTYYVLTFCSAWRCHTFGWVYWTYSDCYRAADNLLNWLHAITCWCDLRVIVY